MIYDNVTISSESEVRDSINFFITDLLVIGWMAVVFRINSANIVNRKE